MPASAQTSKGFLFHDGDVVGTVIVPAHVAPGSGRDPFFKLTNGVADQLGIAGAAPGDGPYHGGDSAPLGIKRARRTGVVGKSSWLEQAA